MTRFSSLSAVVIIGAAVCLGTPAAGQVASGPSGAPRIARVGSGVIQGTVRDAAGTPLTDAMVSALGASSAFAFTDLLGRFTLGALPPGPYVLRVHRTGFASSQRQIIQVLPASSSVIAVKLRPLTAMTKDSGRTGQPAVLEAAALVLPPSTPIDDPDGKDGQAGTGSHDHGEVAWRLRHIKRSVLKDATEGVGLAPADPQLRSSGSTLGRTIETPVRLAAAFLNDIPFSGQINILTSGSLDGPSDLLASNGLARGVAYITLGAPVGERGEWVIRGAMTQGDVASWFLASSFSGHSASEHRYTAGMSYATQRNDTNNPLALTSVAYGRNAGTLYAVDEWTISKAVALSYGARYDRYDYLHGGMFSPRLEASVRPGDRWRIYGLVSRRQLAPGAEEFVAPASGVWVPPERRFSLVPTQDGFLPETTKHYEVSVERELGAAYLLRVRSFIQKVDDQLTALFDARVPGQTRDGLASYMVGNLGAASAAGWSVGLSRQVAGRVRGSVEYSFTTARWTTPTEEGLLAVLAPSLVRRPTEGFHDLTTSLETKIPETSTRVFIMCKLNTGFTRRDAEGRTPGFDGRFDVQVNQALPFLNFSSAQWELLLAVRNVFREAQPESSVFDELMVVRPPKRFLGGVRVRF
jgi:hypothetical protein